jgi:hypothetical protein
MIGAEHGPVDGDGAHEIALGVGQTVLAEFDLAGRGQYGGDVGMLRAEALLADRQRASQMLFGLRGLSLRLQRLRQHHQGRCRQRRL